MSENRGQTVGRQRSLLGFNGEDSYSIILG